MKDVIIVIPLHNNILNEYEWKSLHRCVEVLSSYDICIVKPESLHVDKILNAFPTIKTLSFPDNSFLNITAYNQLMMTAGFYQQFLEYKYILIYQTDAWVFRDELLKWIEKDYDYVGAPWLKKEVYSTWYYQFYQKIASGILGLSLKSQKVSGKSGNGGLSLRKTETHYLVCLEKKDLIQKYIQKSVKSDLFNEDVFWSTENPEFIYPDYSVSLRFSWDQYPEKAYEAAGRKLPFGCHGWYKSENQLKFWQQFIK